MEYIGNIISAITVILVALIEARAAKERKRMTAANKRNEEYLARRAEENRLSMDLIDAAVSLSVATANAIAEGKINGKMTEAREKAERAQDDYNAFIRETAAQQYAKF